MSDFSLCDTCANKRHRLTPSTCMCRVLGETSVKVMHDNGSKDGRRYDEPTHVCGPYSRKDGGENE